MMPVELEGFGLPARPSSNKGVPMPTKSQSYVRCIDGFIANRTIVKGGQILAANDRMVKGREHLFVPLEDDDTIREATTPLADRKINAASRNRAVVGGPNPAKPAPKPASTEGA